MNDFSIKTEDFIINNRDLANMDRSKHLERLYGFVGTCDHVCSPIQHKKGGCWLTYIPMRSSATSRQLRKFDVWIGWNPSKHPNLFKAGCSPTSKHPSTPNFRILLHISDIANWPPLLGLHSAFFVCFT